jgi:lipopolysaccharide export system protein LptA
LTNIRTARAILLASMVIFAGVIAMVIWRSIPEEAAVLAERPVPAAPEQMPVEGTIESAASTFLFTEEKDGEVVTRLQAGRMLGMEGGSRVLSEIVLEFRPDPDLHPDQIAEIRGAAGRFDATASRILLQGDVIIRMATGETLETSAVEYSLKDRIATTTEVVTFSLATMRGSARGLSAHLAEEKIQLQHDVDLLGLGEGAGKNTRILADGLEHDGMAGRTALTGDVTLTGSWGRFEGRGLAVTQSADRTQADSMSPGALHLDDEHGASRFILTADAWVFHLSESRQIEGVEAIGQARLTPGVSALDLPLQELSAPRMLIEPAVSREGTSRLFAFGEVGEPVRARLAEEKMDQVTAGRLTLESGAGQEGWVLFQEDVHATGPGGSLRGTELLAHRDGSIDLTGTAAAPAQVVEPDRAMTAEAIHYDPDGNSRATGGVQFNGTTDDGGPRLAVVADQAVYTAHDERLRLEGAVRAWQGSDSLQAAWLEMERPTSVLRAGGGVVTSLGSKAEGERLNESARAHVQAEEVVWERDTGKARFTGEVLLTRDQMNLKSQVLDLRSAAEDEYAFTASGQVLIWNSEWTGSGDRLFSRGEKEPYHLESDSGMATVTSLASGSILRGARLLIHPEDGKAEVESLPGGRITIRSPATDQGEAGR